jgi:two-component system, OmpR family, phosphate regulon sensor histidine kinase PhoR
MNDNELLAELSKRFEKNKDDLSALNTAVKDLEKVNEKLIRAEKVKSDFLSNIRNEIINPLSSIIGLSAMLMNKDTDPLSIEKKATLINEEAIKLNYQLRNVFTAAELEAGRCNLELSNVNLKTLLETVIHDFSTLATKKNVKVTITTTVNQPLSLHNDAGKLYTIFSNFLANAIEFSHPNSLVNIEIDNFTVAFKDQGIGISKKDHAAIFDRFVQLNSGSTKLYAGHGLGLAVVKDLADIISATLTLNSELDQGSTFKVNLQELDPTHYTQNANDDSAILLTNDDDGILF